MCLVSVSIASSMFFCIGTQLTALEGSVAEKQAVIDELQASLKSKAESVDAVTSESKF